MLYVAEEKLLIAAFYDSTIRIYDEGNSEDTVLLKVRSVNQGISFAPPPSRITILGMIVTHSFQPGHDRRT